MDKKRYPKTGLAFLLYLVVFIGLSQAASAATVRPDATQQVRLESSFGKFPLYFIENQGQVDARVGYYVQGRETSVYFTSEGVTFLLDGSASTGEKSGIERASFPERLQGTDKVKSRTLQRYVMKLDFVDANRAVRPEGQDPKPAVISYFKGSRDQWRTGLKTYGSVLYRDLWPGIDLIYTGTVNRLKYSFLVKPGADPDRIRLAYRGVSSLGVTDVGQLEIRTPLKTLQDDRPVAYQEVEGRTVEVRTAYAVKTDADEGARLYGFKVGDYDRSKLLVLDPAVLVYCGYIGGMDEDHGHGIAVDGGGNAYVTGATWSDEATFPVTGGPDLTFNRGYTDAFVAKVNPSGTALLYCGYIGGNGYDNGHGIAVDGYGNAYLTGSTNSREYDWPPFPVIVGPDLTWNGNYDAFVAKVVVGPEPPAKPTGPAPVNAAANICTNPVLSWSSDATATSYDVYFGTDSTPDNGEFKGNQTNTQFQPGRLGPNTTYYWRVDAKNQSGTAAGDVWSFTTGSKPCIKAMPWLPLLLND